MTIVSVIEVIVTSEKSIEDAVQIAVRKISRSIRNIDAVWIKDIRIHVSEGAVITYHVTCKISFRTEKTAQVRMHKSHKE